MTRRLYPWLWAPAAALLAVPGLTGNSPSVLKVTVRESDRPVRNAVVWLDAPNAAKPAKEERAVVDQRNMTFIPHVLAVRSGTRVDFPNNDRVFHNVFSFRDGKPFDLRLYPTGTSRSSVFPKPGLCRLFCNIHPNMAAYIMVVDTPYFGVSDAAGETELKGVPAGTYPYHAWRPGGKELKGTVTLPAGQVLDIRW